MKKIYIIIFLFIINQSAGFAQITVTLSSCGPNTFTLFGLDSTGRNIYFDANSDYAIQWNADSIRWEIVEIASSSVWYTNTYASIPNPPCDSIGSWVSTAAGLSCGNISEITGDCQLILGIGDLSINNAITVFPNPSTGLFHFTHLKNTNNIEIYDMTGRLVLEVENDKSEYTLELTEEVKGMYFYKITDKDNKIKQGKLILR